MITDRSTAVLAHGLGGSTDLPIPLSYALIGAAWALTFTFAVVALAWRRPRFDPDKPGRPLPRRVTTLVDAPATRWAVAIAALMFAVWVAITAVFGPQDANNPLPGVFYVLLWVGLVALSLVVGPVWRVISPVRTVHRLLAAGRSACAIRSGRVIGPPRPACSLSSGSNSPAPPGIPRRDQDLAARLPRRDDGRSTVLR